MRLLNPAQPGRAVRLGYCMNLHPGETLAEVRTGLERIACAVRARIAPDEPRFGVGAYLAAELAHRLAASTTQRAELAAFLRARGLDAFTWNAFPYAGFHAAGLKARVFEPTWAEPARRAFTLDVARVAVACLGAPVPGRHLSISTHAGAFGAAVAGPADVEAIGAALGRAAADLAALERDTGWRIVLSLEPEPRSAAGSCAELRERLHAYRDAGARALRDERGLDAGTCATLFARHLGACVDACHAAVEFEQPDRALEDATAGGAPLGKLQLSSALRLPDPDLDDAGREALLAMDEPVYLHQVNGRRPDGGLSRALDLPEARARHASGELTGCTEWRCHFHVPVDLGALPGAGDLTSTRDHADALLAAALERPEQWGTDELHVEIETYTWSVLPGPARTAEDLADGLCSEYAHALNRLAAHGWEPAEGAGAMR